MTFSLDNPWEALAWALIRTSRYKSAYLYMTSKARIHDEVHGEHGDMMHH